MGKATVVVVDDHPMLRAGVVKTLDRDPDLEVVGEGGSAAEAIELATRLRPDIVLLDVTMPGGGIEAAQGLVNLEHPPKIMMLTVSEEDDHLLGALDKGAMGYALKGVKAEELIAAVKVVLNGDAYVSPSLTKQLIAKPRALSKFSSLTKQEERTLRLITSGMNNREIAQELDVVESTVKAHMSSILSKLKARNRVEAAMMAQREWSGRTDQ